jgi:type II secretory pathway pseudopilin PulG
MSIASLGIIGGLASTTAPQRAAETERAERQSVDQARTAETAERAENAAGIGQTEEDSQTSERDADGRRPWEKPTTDKKTTAKKPDDTATDPLSPLAKDPTGECGGQLDLVG